MGILNSMNEGYFLSFPPLTSLIIAAIIAGIAIMAWGVRKALESFSLSKRRMGGSSISFGHLSEEDGDFKNEKENPHATFLRQRMADIWLHCFDQPVAQRTLPLLSVWTTLYDVVRALLRKKVTFAQLEPEICDFESIILWLSVEGEKAVEKQEIEWSYFSVEGKKKFENTLFSYRVLLRFFQESSGGSRRRTAKSEHPLLT